MRNRSPRTYRRRSGDGFGSTVGDIGGIASRLSARGDLLCGLIGFALLYWVVPAVLTAWLENRKASMTGSLAPFVGQLFDTAMVRRFVDPAKLAGIATLILCTGIAVWKALQRRELSSHENAKAGWLAKLLARFFD